MTQYKVKGLAVDVITPLRDGMDADAVAKAFQANQLALSNLKVGLYNSHGGGNPMGVQIESEPRLVGSTITSQVKASSNKPMFETQVKKLGRLDSHLAIDTRLKTG